jgi:DNA adenine methylase
MMSNRNLSPLRYPGGKGNFKSLIETSILTNGLDGCRYLEPFAGGAGAALGLLCEDTVSEIFLNDKDPAVFAFWVAVVRKTDVFCELIDEVPLTVDEWQRQKEIYRRCDFSDPLKLGFAFFYLNRTNHSGILKAGPIGGYDQTGNYKLDARFNRVALQERVRRIGIYSDQIHLSNQEALDFLKEHFGSKTRSFYYIDPPYYIKGSRLYEKYFIQSDHEALAQFLSLHTDKNWLMSYDDVAEIDSIYCERLRYRIGLRYSVAGARGASEMLIASSDCILPVRLQRKFAIQAVA